MKAPTPRIVFAVLIGLAMLSSVYFFIRRHGAASRRMTVSGIAVLVPESIQVDGREVPIR